MRAPSFSIRAHHVGEIGDNWWGFTQCETLPSSYLNVTPGIVPPDRVGMVEAHERDHREYMARFGSCDAWKRAMDSTPQLRIDMEASAHCAGARYEYERGAHPSLLLAMVEQAAWFSWYFWRGDTRPALVEISKWCQQ